MSTEYSQSAISFAEHKDPITDEIATVLMDRPGGRKAIVAHIREDYDPNAKRKLFRVFDTEGKEMMGPSYSLSILKKDIQKQEQLFHEKVALKEQAIGQDFSEEERKRLKELRTLRSGKQKEQSRTR